ncbi:MAG: hypothetical protein A3C43_08790 [Candidatus Schekmanbacteria bacterium RIFCSPHIGHO2_02_FULL_38_11]|uniref:HTH marR-type domain-containing protein n=1 Tax=Candidatus Schekmanbacteria bacterium RIFCSPLOWO2_12_FULL_38_15 TaxID=1817883 RepID=A0A1F7SL84_9BACT|nr:MAG: hypothetical protein A2043_07120 [Candidatus Schekmanbacteria bacterium GWA2_38_9]OGL47975.1 MAG: hypothetical protein A3H37_08090 [Candidatus Schekmanbacteria bacterium RIFCSPLOWO2_02_FULL_38_14]OGL49008.1 MAG: hypothetical protein A3C43_08790 [Candidatus Schekmanbacteria bacterium RIFCSPHIGHO2_02_FULL_38_11]OGL54540.1 MAG: hypothetical protein A3G31_10300 [Candidatus Schekmanbacteria bacterium RIFCSPLOWO2_12_FULL_38_15]
MQDKEKAELVKKAKRFEKVFGEFFKIVRLRKPSSFSNINITEPQYFALNYLARNNNCTMGEMKEHLDVSLSTLTGIIDRMVRDGFVERQRGIDDRRLVRVKLTPKGDEIIEELNRKRQDRIVAVLEILNREDQELLIGTIERLTEHLNQNSKKDI